MIDSWIVYWKRTLGLMCVLILLAPGFTALAVQEGGELTVVRALDSDFYDPHKITARAAAEVIYLLSDTLVSLDFDLQTIQPGLAERWEVSEDGLVYTFYLREDVSFHSGRAFTAEDVKYSIDRWTDPETNSPVAWRAGDVSEIRVVDEYTVEYVLNEPFNELLYQLTQPFAVMVDREVVEELGEQFGVSGFGGTGPYRWVSWEPRNSMVLERNPDYRWGPPIYENRGPARIERIVWRVLPEDATRVAELETGRADATTYLPPIDIDRLMANPRVAVERAEPYFWTRYVGFKIDRELVADERVRRALSHAVDQEAIVDAVYFGHAEPATGYVHPDTLDYWSGVGDIALHYDPELANTLLDEAGWTRGADGFREKDGVRLAPNLYTFNSASYREIAEAMQGMLRDVGVDLRLELFDATVAWARLRTQEFDTFMIDFPYTSVGDAFNLYFRSDNVPAPNRMNWTDEETDRLLGQATATSDAAERGALYQQLQQRIYEATVWIPISHEFLYLATNPRVHDLHPHGIYGVGLYKALDAWLE